MKQSDIIWILVPVYNVEKLLGKCIRSIQRQTYTNWKLVLVDDGSTDRSGQICDDFARKDHRISVLHTPNGGPHVARKIGLKAIDNDGYFCFCDSDDEMPKNALQLLHDEVLRTNADLICGNVTRILKGVPVSEGSTLSCFSDPRTYSHEEIVSDLYLSCFGGGRFPVSLWGKLYQTKLIRPIILSIDTHPRYFAEDLNMIMQILPELDSLSVINDPVYHYRMGGGTSRFMPTFLDDNILMFHQKMRWKEKCTSAENAAKLICVELKNIIVSYWIMCEKSCNYPQGSLMEEVKAVCALPEVQETLTMLDGDRSGLPGINQPLIDRDYAAICSLIKRKVKKDRPKDIVKKILLG